MRSVSKWTFKREVKKYTRNKFLNELLESVKGYKKLNYDEICKREFKRKSYFSTMSLDSSCMAFRVASKMVQLPANFPAKYRRSGESMACPSCAELSPATNLSRDLSDASLAPPTSPPILSQSHLLTNCLAVSDLRADCRLDSEESIALFFRRVMARHLEIDINDSIDV